MVLAQIYDRQSGVALMMVGGWAVQEAEEENVTLISLTVRQGDGERHLAGIMQKLNICTIQTRQALNLPQRNFGIHCDTIWCGECAE